MNLSRRRPVLITSAAESRELEIQRRQRRYLWSMSFRVVCFVLAVLVLTGWARFVAVIIALIVPWVAVVIANGGPPPPKHRPAGYAPPEAAAGPSALGPARGRVVEPDDLDDLHPRDANPRDPGRNGPAPEAPDPAGRG